MIKLVSLGILLTASFLSAPAQAGLKEILHKACAYLLSFPSEGKESLALGKLKKWGFDREVLEEKFYAPHIPWLVGFAEGGKIAHFRLEWSVATPRETIATILEKHSKSVATINFSESVGGAAIVELSAEQLRYLLSGDLIVHASFVVEVPDPAIFENLSTVPRSVLEKMSRNVLDKVLVRDLYFDKYPLAEPIRLDFSDALLNISDFLGQSKIEIRSIEGRSAYVSISSKQLVQILNDPLTLRASFSAVSDTK